MKTRHVVYIAGAVSFAGLLYWLFREETPAERAESNRQFQQTLANAVTSPDILVLGILQRQRG